MFFVFYGTGQFVATYHTPKNRQFLCSVVDISSAESAQWFQHVRQKIWISAMRLNGRGLVALFLHTLDNDPVSPG
jgi:hypothetical protein